VNLPVDALADWTVAKQVADRVAGPGPVLGPVERARLREDFGELVPQAERLVADFAGLQPNGHPSRPWVMSRSEWLGQNLRSFQVVLHPIAERLAPSRTDGAAAALRRKVLGAEVGALLGYLSRKVLGQFDLFVPPDDEGTIYFVGPNISGVERQHQFPERDFRLWLALHEVAHRLQFGSVPWLRGYVAGLAEEYIRSMNLDVKALIEVMRRAAEDVRSGRLDWRGAGWVVLMMTPEQRVMFSRMQAVMTLLEGHSNWVMDAVGEGWVDGRSLFRQTLRERRRSHAVERSFQRAIGFDQKTRQYDHGERFVVRAVELVGVDGFNRVWAGPANLPTVDELSHPEGWAARVGGA
jgi:coenzyme F420 biosynthesis associated uncharacterized protein